MNHNFRDVYCLFGLVFDPVDLNQANNIVCDSIANNRKLFISTPNLNFLITSQLDDNFRLSVINSNLSVVDGQILVWIGKLLGIPFKERVAGSDLIESLMSENIPGRKLNVFFFGGQDSAAKNACHELNKSNNNLRCSGFYYPGFGSVNDMSSDAIIDEINDSNSDFIIVSLGAKKGQEWIINNISKLKAPVVSHLGAVVNFISKDIVRAPKFISKIGFEWLWRIKEEPGLWLRYYRDFYYLVTKIFPRIVSLLMINFINIRVYKKYTPATRIDNKSDIIYVSGYLTKSNKAEMDRFFDLLLDTKKDLSIIIEKDTFVDLLFVGKLVLAHNITKTNNINIHIESRSKVVSKVLYYCNCGYLVNS